MKICLYFFLLIVFSVHGQWEGNSTPTYDELIQQCKSWAQENKEIELFEMGQSDYGLPIYLFIVNGANDSLKTFEKARNSTTILVNNAIHPGEPDGINAMLIWTRDWIKKGKKTKNMPVLAFIPAYNVGGMMVRSGTSRANQNGPIEYGFRGNAQNLDLNRDFIKMDSKNAFVFTKIFHGLDPDVFLDNHVTNGADYQHILTLISPLKERLAPSIKKETYDKLLPELKEDLQERKIELVPYVDMKKETPDDGLVAFNDLPRYAQGYASLFHCFSFTVETHMLKPFPERVQATLIFLEEMIDYCTENHFSIEKARREARTVQEKKQFHFFNYNLDESKADTLIFSGFTAKHKKSEVTGLERMYYDRNEPWTKKVPYYNHYRAADSVRIPRYFIIGGQAEKVVERLKANEIVMQRIEKDTVMVLTVQKIMDYKSIEKPYENHFMHWGTKVEYSTKQVALKKGDYLIPAQQEKGFFLLSTMFAQTEDSYFTWNFFDSYLDEKEYFSPYVFEDIAADILSKQPDLKKELEDKRAVDTEFAKSQWAQLYFIYTRSPYFEPSFRVIPVYLLY